MTNTDLESIAHLDFDVNEEKAVPCEGSHLIEQTGAILGVPRCKRPAVLIATKACCGLQKTLCIECYNLICREYFKFRNHPTGGVLHGTCNRRMARPFLDDVQYL